MNDVMLELEEQAFIISQADIEATSVADARKLVNLLNERFEVEMAKETQEGYYNATQISLLLFRISISKGI